MDKMNKEKIEENYWLVVCLLVIVSILIFLIAQNFISNNKSEIECYKIGNLPQELVLIDTTDNPFIQKYFNGTSYEICRNKRE